MEGKEPREPKGKSDDEAEKWTKNVPNSQGYSWPSPFTLIEERRKESRATSHHHFSDYNHPLLGPITGIQYGIETRSCIDRLGNVTWRLGRGRRCRVSEGEGETITKSDWRVNKMGTITNHTHRINTQPPSIEPITSSVSPPDNRHPPIPEQSPSRVSVQSRWPSSIGLISRYFCSGYPLLDFCDEQRHWLNLLP